MTLPLQGRTVALAEGRQLEELAEHARKGRGRRCCAARWCSILDAPDPAPVVAWLRELVSGRFAYVILMTGEGVRRLLGFAEREGLRDAVIAALARTRTVTRGPKPGPRLKEVGLAPREAAADADHGRRHRDAAAPRPGRTGRRRADVRRGQPGADGVPARGRGQRLAGAALRLRPEGRRRAASPT